MGCGISTRDYTISTENNLVALVISNKTQLIIKKIKEMGTSFNPNAPINFRSDTILHYACAKNNKELVNFLIDQPDVLKSVKNKLNQQPKQLTTDKEI
jgi:ankyrin repeat protein